MQVETIVISVISMLSDPTDESPANLDAAVSTAIALCLCSWTVCYLLSLRESPAWVTKFHAAILRRGGLAGQRAHLLCLFGQGPTYVRALA